MGFKQPNSKLSPKIGAWQLLPQHILSIEIIMSDEKTNERQPLTPVQRKRLQKCFEAGSKVANSGNFDYATEMFTQCVVGDPSSFVYLQSFIGNLQKKYDNNKKGAGFAALKTAGSKASMKKSSMQKDWVNVIKTGVEVLKLNPWDAGALMEMATACEPDHLDCPECELLYLRSALDGNMKDANVNRRAAKSLERQGQFDAAIICWRRVELALPADEEAKKMIGDLSVKKTIEKGGYESAGSSRDVKSDKLPGNVSSAPSIGSAHAEVGMKMSPEDHLKRTIQKNPADVAAYLQLADLYQQQENLEKCEETLAQALQISGNDYVIQEKMEDIQILVRKKKIEVADQRFQQAKTEEADQIRRTLRAELNKFELDIFRARSDRNPSNLALWFEMAVRLERSGNAQEAIKAYQKARGDETRKGQTLMGLGRCFVAIKQYQLGMSHLQEAVTALGQGDQDLKKEALYNVGKLAMGLNDAETARKYLNDLASLDYGYKDVAQRLDKLNQIDHID